MDKNEFLIYIAETRKVLKEQKKKIPKELEMYERIALSPNYQEFEVPEGRASDSKVDIYLDGVGYQLKNINKESATLLGKQRRKNLLGNKMIPLFHSLNFEKFCTKCVENKDKMLSSIFTFEEIEPILHALVYCSAPTIQSHTMADKLMILEDDELKIWDLEDLFPRLKIECRGQQKDRKDDLINGWIWQEGETERAYLIGREKLLDISVLGIEKYKYMMMKEGR